MTTSPHIDALSIETLRGELSGQVIAPGDAEYETSRLVFAGSVDRRPAVIVRPRDASEVARVVSVARESGLDLAVRGGGHSVAGHGVCDDGIVIDLANLRGLDIDPEDRTAWAQSGLTTGEYASTVAEHGLATGFGDTSSVGIGGLTLGGGLGFLTRADGMTIDNLLGAEIVTADGRILQVDPENHPTLFWALRGGGGNFGVVTRFRYRLRELPGIVGGPLVLPASAEVVSGFVAAAEAAPEELTTIANVMPVPPLPFVPAEHHGRLAVLASLCFAGPPEAGERAIAPFRALATPLADLVRPMPYTGMFPPTDENFRPTTVGRVRFVDRVDTDVAETIMVHLEDSDAALRIAQLRVLGGAMARVPVDTTAFAHRRSRVMVNLTALYTGDEDRVVRTAWVDEFAAALRQDDTGAFVSFLTDDDPAGVGAAYPASTWDRLAQVKTQYDPGNLFRGNHNVAPAAG
jgi:FAD binding domain/Berberine and berberine like